METWMIIILLAVIGSAVLIAALILLLKRSDGITRKKLNALQNALSETAPELAKELPIVGKHLAKTVEYAQNNAIFYASYEVANAMANKGINAGFVMCVDESFDEIEFPDVIMGSKNIISLKALGITVQDREQMEALLCAIIMCLKVCIECRGLLYECFNGTLSAKYVSTDDGVMLDYTIG